MKRFLNLAILLLFFNVTQAQSKVGQKAPDIALPNVTGVVKKLSEHVGKVVLVDFWASWCTPCRKNNPNLVRLYSKYKDKGFDIFGISIDEDKASWKKAITTDKMSWTHVIENGGWDGPVASAWKIQQIPSSYLLDQSGKIVAVDISGRELEKKIVELLNAKI